MAEHLSANIVAPRTVSSVTPSSLPDDGFGGNSLVTVTEHSQSNIETLPASCINIGAYNNSWNPFLPTSGPIGNVLVNSFNNGIPSPPLDFSPLDVGESNLVVGTSSATRIPTTTHTCTPSCRCDSQAILSPSNPWLFTGVSSTTTSGSSYTDTQYSLPINNLEIGSAQQQGSSNAFVGLDTPSNSGLAENTADRRAGRAARTCRAKTTDSNSQPAMLSQQTGFNRPPRARRFHKPSKLAPSKVKSSTSPSKFGQFAFAVKTQQANESMSAQRTAMNNVLTSLDTSPSQEIPVSHDSSNFLSPTCTMAAPTPSSHRPSSHVTPNSSSSSSHTPTPAQLDLYSIRARNRKAASRCRFRKRALELDLKARTQDYVDEKGYLELERDFLRNEVHTLKHELFAHAFCDCHLIREYLESEAIKIVAASRALAYPPTAGPNKKQRQLPTPMDEDEDEDEDDDDDDDDHRA